MKKLTIISFILLFVWAAGADWVPIPEDNPTNHKMHSAQTPDEFGIDVGFEGSILADDWQCSETGNVDDIHFWISWHDDQVVEIDRISVNIYSDIPADQSSTGYSVPGDVEWSRDFDSGEFNLLRLDDTGLKDWLTPSNNINEDSFIADNHVTWDQVNITDIQNPFPQEKGTIYWLGLEILEDIGSPDYEPILTAGWKETTENWNDDSVWWDSSNLEWVELINPIIPDPSANSIDLAFVITPEPASVLIMAIGTLLIRKK
ncbi:hypothetical protein SMSP2_02651 [Limihaloglobus sulfuriphilus]|uniref:DUF7901 domain-containing protein n=1 Tax=Limihaloglobus sulfuriphilus TaxID=1851148 RepID=A0A1Q2MHZ0_9BACT|nr:hypothetical protein [Limihaloglobus sulfuriphilus]AQQ72269.1 hypothetical protein SMSP2_02651 [Limihaloglobus sulfuriphilus]